MTQKEQDLVKAITLDALQRNDSYDLKTIAKSNDYALSIIIDYLCNQNEKITHINNIINNK